MRIDVRVQRQVLHLHFHDPELSARHIGEQCGISHNTVKKIRAAALKCAKPWSELEAMDDDQWVAALGTALLPQLKPKVRPDWAYVHEQMVRPDATLEVLWREFKEIEPDGVGYTLFAAGYRAYIGSRRISMRRVYIPGDRLCVDFAGRTLPITDPQTGEIRQAQLFVAVMAASSCAYIEVVWTQAVPDWVQCMVHCMAFFGGVPKWVVSDNLKAAVISRKNDHITLNQSYVDCLRHYGCAALPARPRKPKDDGKGKVENAVQVVQRWIMYRLRDRVFFSLDEANAELRLRLQDLNDRAMTGGTPSRRSRFEAIDRPALSPLPPTSYEYAQWRINVRVGTDHLVEHDKSFYSVPHSLRHEQVDLRYSQSLMEIYHKRRRITSHPMATEPGTIRMHDEHRPESHRRVLDGEPRALMLWSEAAGPHTHQMIRYHLMDRTDLTNGLRAARKLRDLARAFGEPRFESVCAYALPLHMTALRRIESILKSKADLIHSNQADQQTDSEPVIVHENLRGAEYFGVR